MEGIMALNIGYGALVAAFIFALLSIVAFVIGGSIKNKPVLVCARICVFIALGLVTAATLNMVYALLNHNFKIEYVAEYTTRDLSPVYLICALWAGNLGTLLFWAWVVAIVGGLVIITSRERDRELAPYATAFVMITEAFLLALLLFVKNPFTEMAFTPTEGLGLSSLFEHLGMVTHPPILIAGYAAFIVPFAMAVAALITGKLGNEWLITARRWALISWLLIGAGIISGCWWSYVSLGDGSYWHWDSVENATLMPWLTATAFLHSISIQRKRSVLKVWSMALVILTFELVIFSTFLSRSDIIASIDTFKQTVFGPSFLVFLGATMLGSSMLVFLRRRQLEGKLQIESLVSKESTFLLTNLLLVASTLAILAGTVYMLLNRDARAFKASLAAPFFNQVNVPIFLAVILLAGLCTSIGWGKIAIGTLKRSLLLPLVAALLLGVVLLIFGVRGWYSVVGLALCCFVPFTAVAEWVKSTRARHRTRGDNYLKAFLGLIWDNKPRHGGYIIHIALIMIAVGVIGSSAFDVTREAALMQGESMTINGYTVVYDKFEYSPAQSRMIFTATVSIYRNGKLIGELKPVKYFDQSFNRDVNTAAIRATPFEDLYVTATAWNEAGLTAFKVRVFPLLVWIWIGGWLMMLGGLIAFWPDKRRNLLVQEDSNVKIEGGKQTGG
jgi:cytochrome c-type biogenesis protein CcmF